MGRRKNGNGESERTGEKERFFALCLGYHMNRESRFLQNLRYQRPYFHIDLNAGPGYNESVRHWGTPVVFMRQAAKHALLAIEASFIEKNPEFHERLRDVLHGQFPGSFNGHLFGTDRNFTTIRGDNEEHLHRFVNEVVPRLDRPAFARGSIISDPNGFARSGGSVSLDALRAATRALPNFLLLIFFPFQRAHRVAGYKDRGERGPIKNVTVVDVLDFLPMRPHWLVARHGAYLYMCGSLRQMPEGSEHVPAWHHESERGREILRHCSWRMRAPMPEAS